MCHWYVNVYLFNDVGIFIYIFTWLLDWDTFMPQFILFNTKKNNKEKQQVKAVAHSQTQKAKTFMGLL